MTSPFLSCGKERTERHTQQVKQQNCAKIYLTDVEHVSVESPASRVKSLDNSRTFQAFFLQIFLSYHLLAMQRKINVHTLINEFKKYLNFQPGDLPEDPRV